MQSLPKLEAQILVGTLGLQQLKLVVVPHYKTKAHDNIKAI